MAPTTNVPSPDPTLLTTEQLRAEVAHLKELMVEKFSGVQVQFRERDERTKEAAIATETAVNAALEAQKEAAGKAEAASGKEFDAIKTLMASNTKSQDDKIAIINGRLDRGEGVSKGQDKSQATNIALAAVIISLLGLGYAVFGSKTTPPQIIVSPPTSITAPTK
jgi:hypothetical protein